MHHAVKQMIKIIRNQKKLLPQSRKENKTTSTDSIQLPQQWIHACVQMCIKYMQ